MTTRSMERLPTHGHIRRLSAFFAAALVSAGMAWPALATEPGAQLEVTGTAVRPILETTGNMPGAPHVSCSAEGLVRQVYLGLADVFRKFSEDERCRAASLAVRMKPAEPLEAVVSFAAANIGGLEITSDPGGAVIWVNGYRLSGGTGMRAVTTVGEKSVRLSLDGYPEHIGTVVVEPARWVTVHHDLKRP